MPCDQIRLQRSDFKNADLAVLRAALIRAGMEITFDSAERGMIRFFDRQTYRTGQFANGAFTVQEGLDVDNIKREYSSEAVERAAKKYAFSLKNIKTTGVNKYVLTRRAF